MIILPFYDTRKYPDKQPDMYTENLLFLKYVKWNILLLMPMNLFL